MVIAAGRDASIALPTGTGFHAAFILETVCNNAEFSRIRHCGNSKKKLVRHPSEFSVLTGQEIHLDVDDSYFPANPSSRVAQYCPGYATCSKLKFRSTLYSPSICTGISFFPLFCALFLIQKNRTSCVASPSLRIPNPNPFDSADYFQDAQATEAISTASSIGTCPFRARIQRRHV
jgi:hypothetical protein